MEWSQLATTAALMDAKEPIDLVDLSSAQKIALKQVQAKEDMKWDLEEALGYEYDTDDFETYLTDNESFLQEALACRQLYWYYLEQNAGEGSAADKKTKSYAILYKRKQDRFASLIEHDTPTRKTVTIGR